MNIIFFGTSLFAVPSLKALTSSGHRLLLVVTQPDRKKGRYLKLTPPPIKEIATALDIPFFQPQDVSSIEAIDRLKYLNADLFVVVSFGQIFSKEMLAIPKKFAINLHASLLPRYRGAAPINWTIINGEDRTGVSVFRLTEKMDAGDIILDRGLKIDEEDNAVTLGEKLAKTGAEVLAEAVDLIAQGKAVFKKQDEALVTFAPKFKKGDGRVDWNKSALELHNRARGLLPWPCAYTDFKDRQLKILATAAVDCHEKTISPGGVVQIEPGLGILIKTGKGCLAIQRLQLEGSRGMGFEEFLRGHSLKTGDKFYDYAG